MTTFVKDPLSAERQSEIRKSRSFVGAASYTE